MHNIYFWRKIVPFVELTVANASVLTILAISFERYYAICEPLRAGYVCTKARAFGLCMLAWFFAALFTSPILLIAHYSYREYHDGTSVPTCLTQALDPLSVTFFVAIITLFVLLPLCILIVLYAIIARHLIADPGTSQVRDSESSNLQRARKQVVLMLGTVVFTFFICLLPFRVFTIWIIFVPDEQVYSLGIHYYYNILYFCRTMLYLNSAVNPILYNLMSSKFRDGFLRLCGFRRGRHREAMLLRRHRWESGSFARNSSTSFHTRCTSLSYSSTRRYNSYNMSHYGSQHQNNSPDFSWRSGSRYSVDSRTTTTAFKDSPERSSGAESVAGRFSVSPSSRNSSLYMKNQQDDLGSPPSPTGSERRHFPHQEHGGGSNASFRRSAMMRSSLLNSSRRSTCLNNKNGDCIREGPKGKSCIDMRPGPESFV